MLILNQSSKPVKVTFSYTGKANFAHLKRLRRYNITLAGIDSARDSFCPPTSAQVRPPRAPLVSPEHHPNRRGALAESLRKRAQRRRKRRQKDNKCQKQHWTVSIQRETKQGRALWLSKKPWGNLSVAKQDSRSLEKVAREQIPADDTGTGGNLLKEPFAG